MFHSLRWLAIVLICPIAFAQQTTISPAKKALIDELITLTRARDQATEAFLQILKLASGTPRGDVGEMRANATASEVPDKVLARTVDLYDRTMTEQQLRDTIAFFKSDAGKSYAALQVALATEGTQRTAGVVTEELQAAIERSKTKRTMADIRTLAIASEAYSVDEAKYPEAADIDSLGKILMPTYVRDMPRVDGWGTAYAYVVSADGAHYRIVSAGRDKTFAPSSLRIGASAETNDDIVYEDGKFVQPASAN